MIAVINTTRAITLIIVTTTIMTVSYEKESVMFVEKKVFTLIGIPKISNGRQKNFGDKTGYFAEIKANTTYF